MKKGVLKAVSLILVLSFLFGFSLVGCMEKSDSDIPKEEDNGQNENGADGEGDVNGNGGGSDVTSKPEEKVFIPFVENGEAKFNFCYNFASASSEIRKEVRHIISLFKAQGVEVKDVNSTSKDDVSDFEILVGRDIDFRDEFKVDTIPLGNEGYAIKNIGNKIVIVGGNNDSTLEGLVWFKENYWKLEEKDTDLKNLSIEKDFYVEVKQEFCVSKIAFNDKDIRNYKIAFDKSNIDVLSSAIFLHDRIYAISGYWLELVDIDENVEDEIVLSVNENCGAEGFRVMLEKGVMSIECAFSKVMDESVRKFGQKYLSLIAEGEIMFDDGIIFTDSVRTISYCEYGGAVGDGRTDDYLAMKKTHDRANITGQTVVADAGKKFNVGKHDAPIIIKTDTVFSGAEIIIDDSDIKHFEKASAVNVFKVQSDKNFYVDERIKSLKAGQKNVGVTFPEKTLLHIKNSNKKQYIRYGENENSGHDMMEVILVDKDGNVDPNTPIMWDYDTVTEVVCYPADDKPLSILGGTLVTKANQAPRNYHYYTRGILINRSNVTVRGQKHIITGEGENGDPYRGIYDIRNCNNVTLEDCIITGHKKYYWEQNPSNGMGSYELSSWYANDIVYKNITQTNDITDSNYWGVMGSNYCKNITYDGCKLSRFDAHCGVYNATVKNSEIGHQHLAMIGYGTMTVENTVFHGNTVVNLRNDYGSTWHGDVILKNITVLNTTDVTLFGGSWVNHNFGYTCYLPTNVTVDGVKLADNTKSVYVFGSFGGSCDFDKTYLPSGEVNNNVFVLPKSVKIVSNRENNEFKISGNPIFKKVYFENA